MPMPKSVDIIVWFRQKKMALLERLIKKKDWLPMPTRYKHALLLLLLQVMPFSSNKIEKTRLSDDECDD